MMDVEQRRYPEAVAHFREALARDPDNVLALQKLARLLASCSDRDVRDGEEAVRLAERACAAAGEPRLELLRTLAVAQVEAGRYAEAIQTADQAIALAREAGLDGLAATLGFLRSRCVERLSASPESTQTRPAEE
jgi:tetratricopeptide (TPR) repeat protein